jgi:hypothetical protein
VDKVELDIVLSYTDCEVEQVLLYIRDALFMVVTHVRCCALRLSDTHFKFLKSESI